MFWAFLGVLGLGLMLVKLGALSVWVSVLSLLLKLALVLMIGLLGFAAWQRLTRG